MAAEPIKWNDGSTWSKQATWNGVRESQPKVIKMAQATANISRLSEADFIKRAKELKAGMTGNAVITTPDPTVVAVGLLITEAENKMAIAKTADEAAQTANHNKDVALQLVAQALNQWCVQVQKESKGDPAIISSTNFGVKATPGPAGPLAQVQNLSLTEGDNPGELDAHWDPVKGRTNFEVALCLGDPAVEANWHLVSSGTKSSCTLKGLTSGTKAWIRVRAKAPKADNDGPWSQPATKIVP